MTIDATADLSVDNGGDGNDGNDGNVAPAVDQTWTSGLDEDASAYVQNKGWKDPSDMLSSYRNLEKFAGGSKNLVELPGPDADEAVYDSLYSSLGRPETSDKYGLQIPDGADKELVDWFKETAHKTGLSDKQASLLFNEWNQLSNDRLESMRQSAIKQSETSIAELKKEWGQSYNHNIDAGKRAVSALGYDEAALGTLESKLGTADMLKLFATLGSKMGEDDFAGGARSDKTFGIDSNQATQQIAELKMDKSFMDQYLGGNKDAVSKMKRLMEAAYD